MLEIDLDPTALAYMLFTYSKDWETDLEFIDTVSAARGLYMDKDEVSRLVRELYG